MCCTVSAYAVLTNQIAQMLVLIRDFFSNICSTCNDCMYSNTYSIRTAINRQGNLQYFDNDTCHALG